MYFEGNCEIPPIQEKSCVSQNSKIPLGVEAAPGQYRPTQFKLEIKNQGECFALP